MVIKRLTEKQIALLDFIRGFVDKNTYPPTYEEIRSGMDWSTKSLVDYHLSILERKGYLCREAYQPRTIVLTEMNSITTQEA
jgi:repressor LexA